MDLDTRVKLAIYGTAAASGKLPTAPEVARRLHLSESEAARSYARIAEQRLLLLEPDGVTIRMAPPFSGVPTQHRVLAGGVEYFANCAWDALGIPAALHQEAQIHSRCEQSLAPLHLSVGLNGPPPSDWLFHVAVPAARWWDDLVFT
jgi:hypothetical protein